MRSDICGITLELILHNIFINGLDYVLHEARAGKRLLLLGLQQKKKRRSDIVFQSILRYFTFSPHVQDLEFSFLELYKDFVG